MDVTLTVDSVNQQISQAWINVGQASALVVDGESMMKQGKEQHAFWYAKVRELEQLAQKMQQQVPPPTAIEIVEEASVQPEAPPKGNNAKAKT